MDTNMRMSTVRPTPNPKARAAKREEEDNFLVLPDRNVADCMNDLGLDISTADLQRPQPQTIQRIYEYFAEIAMNVSREVVAPCMKAAADDISNAAFPELYPADTLDLLGLFVNLRKLFTVCGIDDFNLQDLFRPTPERVVKQCSYVINFLRFRESQQATTSEYFDKAERTKSRIGVLYAENQAKADMLGQLERNRRATEALMRDKEARSEDLKRRLLELKRAQDKVMERAEAGRVEQARRKQILEDKVTRAQLAKQEAEKLRPYATQSRAALETALDKLRAALTAARAEIEALERRDRALQTSLDSFTTVSTDVDSCVGLLQELSRDLAAEEATLNALAKNRDALTERSNNVRDVERRERQLAKQLGNTQAKTQALRVKAEERRVFVAGRMEEITRVDEGLRRERREGEREMERRRARIEMTEKKMVDLRERVEGEVEGARREFERLEAHVGLYVREMGGCIG